MNKPKNILIVTYYFYPYSQVGAKRISYLADYLNKKGVQVTVIKADNKMYGKDIDECLDVHNNIDIIDIPCPNYNTIISKLLSFVKYTLAVYKILASRSIDLVLFTGGPFFYFPVGVLMKKSRKVPYILDFRDPWVRAHRRFEKLNWKGKVFRFFEKLIESISIKESLLTLYVTESVSEKVRSFFPNDTKDKIVSISNGYDDTRMPELVKEEENHSSIKICIFGKFSYYDKSHVTIIVDGLKRTKQNIQLYHIGETEPAILDLMDEIKHRVDCFQMGYLSYRDGIKELMKMDVLILNNRSELLMGTKVYEYLYLNKPILAFIGKNSAIWHLLSQYPNTFLINTSNDLIHALSIIQLTENRSVISEEEVQKFSRKHQCDLLYNKITEVWN